VWDVVCHCDGVRRVLRGTFGAVRAEQTGHGEELREWS